MLKLKSFFSVMWLIKTETDGVFANCEDIKLTISSLLALKFNTSLILDVHIQAVHKLPKISGSNSGVQFRDKLLHANFGDEFLLLFFRCFFFCTTPGRPSSHSL